MTTRDGIVKWRLPSDARAALTALISQHRIPRGIPSFANPEIPEVIAAIDRAMSLGHCDSLDGADRALLSRVASESESPQISRSVTALLCCADCVDEVPVASIPDVDRLAPADHECLRCGLGPYVETPGAQGPACSFCGHDLICDDPDRARAVLEDRDAARLRMRWMVDPMLHLVKLSSEREDILDRASHHEGKEGDPRRLEVIDQQLEIALRGGHAEYFRSVLRVMGCAVDAARMTRP